MFDMKAIAIASLTLVAASFAGQTDAHAQAQIQGMAQPQTQAGYCKGVLIPVRFYHMHSSNGLTSSRDSFFVELRNTGTTDLRYAVVMNWTRAASTVEKRVTAELRTLKGVTNATVPLGEVITRRDWMGTPPSDADIQAATTITCN